MFCIMVRKSVSVGAKVIAPHYLHKSGGHVWKIEKSSALTFGSLAEAQKYIVDHGVGGGPGAVSQPSVVVY